MNAAIPSFIPPVTPQMPAPMPPQPQADGPGFAQVLSQTQNERAQGEPSAASEEPTQDSQAAQPAKTAQERSRADKARGDRPARAEGSRERAADKADATATERTGSQEPLDKARETPETDPTLAEWLVGLQLPAAPTETPALEKAALAAGKAPATGDELAALQGKAAADQDTRIGRAGAEPAARDAKARPDPLAFDAALSASSAAAAQAGEEGAQAMGELRPAHEPFNISTLVPAAQPTATARSAEAAAPVAAQVATPVTDPEFAQALGVQVSLLARNGVQQAELHLNPADMGPISIQIAIEGSQAQVNFGADVAATRDIIEAGLPELAASLREAGLTLSGGGVHSQARGRGDEGGEAPSRGDPRHGDGPQGEKDVTVQRSQARVAAGGVDVYA